MMHASGKALETAEGIVTAPLIYKGKVRELYDLGDSMLIIVTDRISAFDYVLRPAIPDKGRILNKLSAAWFDRTNAIMPNHVIHTDPEKIRAHVTDADAVRDRFMVVRKAERIDIECVVRGYITGGGWRQYEKKGSVNGIPLPQGLRKNGQLAQPIFTPAAKNDVGHDEDITFEETAARIGDELADRIRQKSLALYAFASAYCQQRGIVLADCKFEFGLCDGRLILIDELFTPDSSRFWAEEKYALDTDIDSMDKEPVRTYLVNSDWDKNSVPDELPAQVVQETSARYREIYRRLH